MINAVTARTSPRLYLQGVDAASPEVEVLRLKPTATTLLRIQGPRSQLHTYASSLRRAKMALEVIKDGVVGASFIPMLKIAIGTISSEIAATKMALMASEEALREAYSYARALKSDSPLHQAALLVLEDYETERAATTELITEIRNMSQPFQCLSR